MNRIISVNRILIAAVLTCAACGGSTPPASDASATPQTPDSGTSGDPMATPNPDSTGTTVAPGTTGTSGPGRSSNGDAADPEKK